MANPSPSPSTRFGAENGNPRNTGGRTSEQRKRDYEAADMAARIRHKALSVMLDKVQDIDDPLLMKELLDAAGLKLIKDSEDRAHGTPKATTEIGGPNGGPVVVTEVAYTVVEPNRED